MPHLIIEYPADRVGAAEIGAALDALHGAAAGSGLFEPGHIRVRAIPLGHYLLGGRREPFVHVQCRIHAGRSEAQRAALSTAVLTAVQVQGWPLRSITVEVVELDRAGYARQLS